MEVSIDALPVQQEEQQAPADLEEQQQERDQAAELQHAEPQDVLPLDDVEDPCDVGAPDLDMCRGGRADAVQPVHGVQLAPAAPARDVAGDFGALFSELRVEEDSGELEAAQAVAAHLMLRLQQRKQLSPHAAVIAEVCMRLPEHLRNKFLQTISAADFVPSNIPWRTSKELTSELESLQVTHSRLLETLLKISHW